MARRIPKIFVPLDVNAGSDPKLRHAGPHAELIYYRALMYAKGRNTDGFIPDYDLDAVGAGIPKPAKAAEALVGTGAWLTRPGGWEIAAWHRWNASPAEMADERARKRLGAMKTNHERYHKDKTHPECQICAEAANTKGQGAA